MINKRLFDHYGIDTTKDLRIKERCPRPFDTVLIDKQGSCYACECQAWLPQSIGNLQVMTLEEILNSGMREHLQGSIEDGTYRYCNNNQCAHLKHGLGWRADRGLQLRLAIDDSCNLRCPSCRQGLVFHKEGPSFRRGIKLADRINTWLENRIEPVQIHLGSDGDPFASHVYRHFMANIPHKDNIKYSVLTNGLMFKEFHTQVPEIINNLTQLGVSIDGATKSTYERLRLGGKWHKIIENLDFISSLRSTNLFEFALHFVVQKENYHEMGAMVDLAKKYNADRLWLNKIEDWQVMEDWTEQDIFSESHPYHSDFVQQLDKIAPMLDREHMCPKVHAPRIYNNKVKK